MLGPGSFAVGRRFGAFPFAIDDKAGVASLLQLQELTTTVLLQACGMAGIVIGVLLDVQLFWVSSHILWRSPRKPPGPVRRMPLEELIVCECIC